MEKCCSHKKVFASAEIAEDVLIELWSKNEYADSHSPIAIYKCEDCRHYHFTSRGPMNAKLAEFLASGKLKRMKEANRWMDKLKKK